MCPIYRPKCGAVIAWAKVVLIAIWVSGCASTQPVGQPPLGISTGSLRPAPPIALGDLYPITAQTSHVSRIVNQGTPMYSQYTVKPVSRFGWQIDLQTVRATRLAFDDEGALVIVRETDMPNAVIIDYDPSIVLLPANVAMGQVIQSKSQVTVRNLVDGKLRDAGWCHYRWELLGIQTIATPTGPVDAYIIRTDRTLELRWAQAKVTTLAAYQLGMGWIGESIDTITRPLRMFQTQEHEEIWLDKRAVAGRPGSTDRAVSTPDTVVEKEVTDLERKGSD